MSNKLYRLVPQETLLDDIEPEPLLLVTTYIPISGPEVDLVNIFVDSAGIPRAFSGTYTDLDDNEIELFYPT